MLMVLSVNDILRKYRSRIEELIQQCPTTSNGYVGMFADDKADQDKAREFMRYTAAVVSELIQDDRGTWEVQVNRSVDIFFSVNPTAEHLGIRNRVQEVIADITDAYRRLVEVAIQRLRESDCKHRELRVECETTNCEHLKSGCFRRHLQKCIEDSFDYDDNESKVDDEIDTVEVPEVLGVNANSHIVDALNSAVNKLSKEPLVMPREYFSKPQIKFPRLLKRGCDRLYDWEPGDRLSWLAVRRLLSRLERFKKWNFWRRKWSLGRPHTEKDVHLVAFDDDGTLTKIRDIENVLLAGHDYYVAHPFIVLAQIYFAYSPEPDKTLLHLSPEVLTEGRRSSMLEMFIPVRIVKDALEQIIDGDTYDYASDLASDHGLQTTHRFFQLPTDYWEIWYGCRHIGPFPDILGIRYIYALIKKQGTPIAATDLHRVIRENPPVTTSSYQVEDADLGRPLGGLEATDEKTIGEVRDAIEGLIAKKSGCENPEEAAIIGEQIEELESYVRSTVDIRGKSRVETGNIKKKAIDAVRAAIKTAVQKIEDASKPCGRHFTQNISFGEAPMYDPRPSIDWDIS